MPLIYLILLFLGLPVIELFLLLKLHDLVGLAPTILIVFGTGILGAWLVRRQGISILMAIQRETAAGNLPAPQLLDGAMILIAGAFLLTPGLLTDAAGFALTVPYVRAGIRAALSKWLERRIKSGYVQVRYKGPTPFDP